jgi:hypothetical protein
MIQELINIKEKSHFVDWPQLKITNIIAHITGLQINLYLEQPMEIQLFATFVQRRK